MEYSPPDSPSSHLHSPPAPPPPTPIQPSSTHPRRTAITFGNIDPSRHRYDGFPEATPTYTEEAHDKTTTTSRSPSPPDIDIDSTQPHLQPNFLHLNSSRRHRPPPRRLSIKTQSSSSTRTTSTGPTWLPKTPLYNPPLTPLHTLLSPTYPFLIQNDQFYTSWEVTYSFSPFQCGIIGGFAFIVFLGPPPSSGVNPEEWISTLDSTGCRIGGHGVSARDTRPDSPIVSGTIPLTKAIIERIGEVGESLEEDTVLPYLRQRLHYVVEKADGGIVTLDVLDVKICCSIVDIEKPEGWGRSGVRYFETTYVGGVGVVR